MLGAFFLKNGEDGLAQWLEQLSRAEPAPWFAVYAEAPPSFKREAANAPTHEKAVKQAWDKLQELFGDSLNLFILGDFSVILSFKGTLKLSTIQLKSVVERYLFDGKSAPAFQLYDLTIQAPLFQQLCQDKCQKARVASTAAAPAATPPVSLEAPLKTPAFKKLLDMRPYRGEMIILVVEDDLTTGKIVGNLLKKHTVKLARSATEALQAYADLAPDLCFLDIGLPDYSGLEVLKIIRAHDANAFAVMLTANNFQQNVETAIQTGIQGFISKPFTLAKVSQYIDLFQQRRKT